MSSFEGCRYSITADGLGIAVVRDFLHYSLIEIPQFKFSTHVQ